MFNLLITGGDNAWNEGSYVWNVRYGRVLEAPYTSALIRKKFGDLTSEVLNFLTTLPTLFLYENGTKGSPQLGKIRNIDRRSDNIRVLFDFENTEPDLTDELVSRLKWELQIDDFEFSRTHWAVKDVDLISVLQEAGLQIQSLSRIPVIRGFAIDGSTVAPMPRAPRSFDQADTSQTVIFFSDVVGSTKLKDILGDSKANKLIQQHFEILRKTLHQERNAREVKTAGDSILCTFEKPSTAIIFALRAQRALHEWNSGNGDKVSVRMGIHIGEVQFLHTPVFDIIGAHVDRCSRIMSEASAGRIYVSKSAYESAHYALKGTQSDGVMQIEWRNRGTFSLKGISEPVEIWEVFDPSVTTEDPPKPIAQNSQTDSFTTGQDSDAIKLLKNLVKFNWRKFQVEPGSGDFLIIEGEPGLGFEVEKEYLQEDLDALVEQGFLHQTFSSQGEKIYAITRTGNRRAQER